MNKASIGHMKPVAAGLLILIMSFLLVNRALYTHVHVLPDGSLESHAHPFSKNTNDSRETSHHHSSLEIILLEQLDVLILGGSALLVLMPLSWSATIRPLAEYPYLPSLILPSSGRAPPTGM